MIEEDIDGDLGELDPTKGNTCDGESCESCS